MREPLAVVLVATAASAGHDGTAIRPFAVLERVPELRRRMGISLELHDRIGQHGTLLRLDRYARGAAQ
jgi:hypothetical protein